jgi:hypothetical protein
MSDCAVAECASAKLRTVPRAPWSSDSEVDQFFDFVLSPDLPPRGIRSYDSSVELKTRCGPGDSELVTAEVASGPDEPGSGRLDPKYIQSVVRSNYDTFKRCYERGLAANPELRGRVMVRFVIQRDGTVGKKNIADNSLTDCRVAECVRDGFSGLKFSPPEGGTVTVVYPIMLEPG